MASIISKVTELDKQMRQKVKELSDEKDKLPVFLREQRKEITKKYQEDAKKIINSRKSKILEETKSAEDNAKLELMKSISDIEKHYADNKDKWIEEIYQQCIKDYSKEWFYE